MIKTIIFDMGNVLINFSHEKACMQIANLAGVSPLKVKEVLFDSGLELAYEAGEVTTDEVHQSLEKSLGVVLDRGLTIDAACDIFWSKDDMELLARQVRDLGYRMVLLSNVNEAHFEYIQKHYKFLDLFHEHVLSYKVGACKPHRRIYEHAVAAAETEAKRCVFIDDVSENVAAASQLGIHALHFSTVEKLRGELQGLGVLPSPHSPLKLGNVWT